VKSHTHKTKKTWGWLQAEIWMCTTEQKAQYVAFIHNPKQYCHCEGNHLSNFIRNVSVWYWIYWQSHL
jgi:hypothetical protein